jgi:hypothetical protein
MPSSACTARSRWSHHTSVGTPRCLPSCTSCRMHRAGIEPATPSLPSMRGWFTTPHSTSRPHTSAQVRSTVRGWCRGAT